MIRIILALTASLLSFTGGDAYAQQQQPYQIYFGTAHAHTGYSRDARRENNTAALHFTAARQAGYQFYAITDHSHRETFTTATYAETRTQAAAFTTPDFVAFYGFEHTETNGPGGMGHLNCYNTADFLNALTKGIDLPFFYDWLVRQERQGLVAASFNHPNPDQYHNWDYFTPERRDAITMLEVINGYEQNAPEDAPVPGRSYYQGWLRALEQGWRVAPVTGLDAHWPEAIAHAQFRTGVLAESLTRESLLRAMKARRTYATMDRNLHALYTANGAMMGSVLDRPEKIRFAIRAWDPDKEDARDRITKLDIVGDGKLVASKKFNSHEIEWTIELQAPGKYYFVRVYTPERDPGPTAYLAPVWTGR